jgi:hypothetical protein
MKIIIIPVSPAPVTSFLLDQNIILSTLFPQTNHSGRPKARNSFVQ